MKLLMTMAQTAGEDSILAQGVAGVRPFCCCWLAARGMVLSLQAGQ